MGTDCRSVVTFQQEIEITDEIKMAHTGGHSDGHAVIILESQGNDATFSRSLADARASKCIMGNGIR